MIYFNVENVFIADDNASDFTIATVTEKTPELSQIQPNTSVTITLPEKCPYLKLFWSAFSHIRTEYGKILTRIAPNTDTFYAM